MITENYSKAYVEVLAIINSFSEEDKNKIPKKLIALFEKNASSNYIYKIDSVDSFDPNSLSHEAKNLLAALYRNYLCTEEEKAEYDKLLADNYNRLEDEKRQKYSVEKLFTVQDESATTELTVIKDENLFKKIFNKIKSLFKFKK